MKFIHITDVHLVGDKGALNGLVPFVHLDACLNDVVQWHRDASFCVISGDLAEFAETNAYQALKMRLSSFPLPCFLMIGNHDNRTVFQSVFPKHPKDSNGYIQHRFEKNGCVFLFLDTKKEGCGVHEGQLCADQIGRAHV